MARSSVDCLLPCLAAWDGILCSASAVGAFLLAMVHKRKMLNCSKAHNVRLSVLHLHDVQLPIALCLCGRSERSFIIWKHVVNYVHNVQIFQVLGLISSWAQGLAPSPYVWPHVTTELYIYVYYLYN